MSEYWTIEGFEKLSKQQLFDMAAAHILRTRVKSKNDVSCSYTGTGCAASVFLKPEFREKADRMGPAGTGISWYGLAGRGKVPQTNREFISALQRFHDGANQLNFMPDWKLYMTILAGNENLSNHLIEADEANERA